MRHLGVHSSEDLHQELEVRVGLRDVESGVSPRLEFATEALLASSHHRRFPNCT